MHEPASAIAVVGMALRVPGADTPERFWEHLLAGRDTLTRADADTLRREGRDKAALADPAVVRAAPKLRDIAYADTAFFGIADFEAELINPEHKLFLECAWEALERAGLAPGEELRRTGVFTGSEGDYPENLRRLIARDRGESLTVPLRTGSGAEFLPARVSHRLGLEGPSFCVLSACATSLVAIRVAVESLRRLECDTAIAGGASCYRHELSSYIASADGMYSRQGRVRSFDAAADGTVFGSGAGAVVLRRLEDAVAAGQPVLAVIRGVGVSNDGGRPGRDSFVAPTRAGQQAAIEAALRDGGIDAASIGYVEAHGTATLAGDPVEVAALREIWQRAGAAPGSCGLGSVKANVGHLRTAAGVVSLIKACLVLREGKMPPAANFAAPNPRLGLEASPFFIPTAVRPFAGGNPRRAGVSSFGFGGSNAHIILEEHRREAPAAPSAAPTLLLLSARDEAALERRRSDLAAHLEEHPELALADVAHTLARRASFAHRAAWLAEPGEAWPARLRAAPDIVGRAETRPVAFLFPGQGAQRPGMGAELYAAEEVYRAAVDTCAALLEPALGLDIRALLRADPGPDAARRLAQTALTQPALFVVEYALARQCEAWGLRPAVMLGHSVGELVAACLAGVFSLEAGLRLVAARARLMQACPAGSMASVFLAAEALQARLPARVELAAVNGPGLCVVSGPTPELEEFCAVLAAEGVAHKALATSHAFHSWMMDAALPEFRELLAGIPLAAPRIPFLSNATGAPISAAQARDPGYWAEHIRRPVRFGEGLRAIERQWSPVYLELGPGAGLRSLVRRQLPDAPTVGGFDGATARKARASAWAAGAALAPEAFPGRRVTLPTYPFQRQRRYVDKGALECAPRFPLKLYVPDWSPEPAAPEPAERVWLVCGDGPLADALADALQGARARFGEDFAGGAAFTVRPDAPEDFAQVLRALPEGPLSVVHLGACTGPDGPHNSAEAFAHATRTGSQSLLAVLQAAHACGRIEGLRIDAVADGYTRRPGETQPLFAEKGGLTGPLRCVPVELPAVGLRLIDLPGPEAVPLATLLDELRTPARGLVLLRPAGRFVETLRPRADLPLSRLRLRPRGVVLISGGAGALGLVAARMLWKEAGARLALSTRWTPPPREEWPARARRDDKIGRALRTILALEADGAEVLLLQADIGEVAEVDALVSAVEQRWGAVHGLIHAAGVNEPTLVLEATPERIGAMFPAKVAGAFHLSARLGALDFCLCFSSQACYQPARGQVGYALANGVLDALMRRRAAQGLGLSCAVGWGPWEEVGMAERIAREGGGPRERFEGAREAVGLPFFAVRLRAPDGRWRYRGELGPDAPEAVRWVLEHRYDGRPLLAGVTQLEAVRAAYVDHVASERVELRDIHFLRPLFVDDGVELEVAFRPAGSHERFELRSRPRGSRAPFVTTSSGVCAPLGPGEGERFLPPADFEPEPPYRHRHVSAGARWQCVRGRREVDGAVWNELALDDAYAADLAAFVLHPATFDVALSGRHTGVEPDGIPFSIARVRVLATPGRRFFLRSEARPDGAIGARLVDAEGRLLVEVDGYLRRTATDSLAVRPAVFRARLTRPGDIASVTLEAWEVPEPGPDEVVIEVLAAGLNFRDVLTALDQMPDAVPEDPPLGVECSGRIHKVGAKVRSFRPGDLVLALARYSFASHVVCRAERVMPLTRNLSPEAAAGIPSVFLTADYALREIARLRPGERVLIHAATGGVGLAAVQLAQKLGAEVFATAGREEKRAHLRALGVEHISDSRSLRFVDDVRAWTDGEGVDIVLNSLAGELLTASLGLLRPYGRFVEIGKRDIYGDTALGLLPFRHNLQFTALDLGKMVDDGHPRALERFDALMRELARGELVPSPTTVLPIEELHAGFERMARAEHIGKLVFRIKADSDPWLAAAHQFTATYGLGISVAAGREALRRFLSCDALPPCLLACAQTLEEVERRERARPDAIATGKKPRPLSGPPYAAPETPTERALVALWEKLLGVAPVGVDDDFFALGGDSISAIQIQYAVQQRHGVRLATTVLFDQPSIRGLAAHIEAEAG